MGETRRRNMSTKETTAANGFPYTLSRTLDVPAASV